MSTPSSHPVPVMTAIRRVLIEDVEGHVLEIDPHEADHAVVAVETTHPDMGLCEPGRCGCAPQPRTVVDIGVRVVMDSMTRPAGAPVQYVFHEDSNALVMRQQGHMAYMLGARAGSRGEAAPEADASPVDPNATEIGVPDQQQPALVFVHRDRDTLEPGSWTLGNGPESIPEGRLEQAMLRALLTTALADLDDAQGARLTAADLGAGAISTGRFYPQPINITVPNGTLPLSAAKVAEVVARDGVL